MAATLFYLWAWFSCANVLIRGIKSGIVGYKMVKRDDPALKVLFNRKPIEKVIDAGRTLFKTLCPFYHIYSGFQMLTEGSEELADEYSADVIRRAAKRENNKVEFEAIKEKIKTDRTKKSTEHKEEVKAPAKKEVKTPTTNHNAPVTAEAKKSVVEPASESREDKLTKLLISCRIQHQMLMEKYNTLKNSGASTKELNDIALKINDVVSRFKIYDSEMKELNSSNSLGKPKTLVMKK